MIKKLQIAVLVCLFCPFSIFSQQLQNLLANPGATAGGTTGWNVTSSSDDGWAVSPTGGTEGGPCWVSSYSHTTKSQEIDLVSLGFQPAYLDQQPIVLFAENYEGESNGSSVADEYQLNVILLDANGNTIQSYSSGVITCTGTWQMLKGSIRNYGTGLRKIKYEHIGHCANFWTGNYGAKIDDSHLSIGNNIYYAGGKTNTLAGWNVTANGGDGWIVDANGWYLTSFDNDTKSQVVDLVAQGYTINELDNQPFINFHEWVIGTQPDFADYYNQVITLLDANGNTIASSNLTPTLTSNWQLVSGSFSSYGPGLRSIKFEHTGKDVEYFAGHYGASMDDAEITLGAATSSVGELNSNRLCFKLFPNPSNGEFTISLRNIAHYSPVKVKIMDMQGRLVFEDLIQPSQTSICQKKYHINTLLDKGFYMITIADSQSNSTTRFLVQ